MATHAAKRAELHRMVMENHTCPYGLKALDLLKRGGYEVDDHHLTTRAETDAFKAESIDIFGSDFRVPIAA